MGSHPLNLAVRFVLEVLALMAAGHWGWKQAEGTISYLLVILIPFGLGILWNVFAVPGDPSRSGKAPVPVPGYIRLILELLIFAFACWMLYDLEKSILSLSFGIIVTIHYLISYDRIQWLLSR
jgi:membrane protein YdbS with pleckstrin-like domain